MEPGAPPPTSPEAAALIRLVRLSVEEHGAAGGRALWTAAGAVGARPGLLLTIEDERGERGQGEASPLPGYSPDTLAACRAALEALSWRGRALDSAAPLLPQIAGALEEIDAGLPAARFALETALLDLAGRRLGQPCHRLLADDPAARLPLSFLLVAESAAELVVEARTAIAAGAGTLKWKIGRPGRFADELDALRALRQAVGDGVAIRLDANRGFAAGEVEGRLRALAAIDPELIEEPVDGPWAALPPHPPVAVAADESLADARGVAAALVAIGEGRCAALVLKPTVRGGALACLKLAREAAQLGAATLVTHAFEGPIALAAAAALALSTPPPRRAAGLAPHAGLAAWPSLALPMFDGGELRALDAPGLGVSLPERR